MTSMNPFEENTSNLDDLKLDDEVENNSQADKRIVIKVTKNPKKSKKFITIVSNWNLPEKDLKQHKSAICKAFGISGSMKEELDLDNQKTGRYVLTFSTKNKSKILEYIKNVSN